MKPEILNFKPETQIYNLKFVPKLEALYFPLKFKRWNLKNYLKNSYLYHERN